MTDVVETPTGDGIYPAIPETLYHADRASLSVSGAKLLMPPSCPALFRQRMDAPQKPNRVFDFGHLAHLMVLGEGLGFSVLYPEVHGLKRDNTVADNPRATSTWKAAEADAREKGLVPVHIEEYQAAEAMALAVHSHLEANRLFAEGIAEQSMYATDPETGVQLRGRMDWLTTDQGRPLIVDYKTSVTANPAELQRRMWQLKYHCQAAWYADLFTAIEGVQPRFLFVVQEKTAPHLVMVVEYDDDAITEGRRLNRNAIRLYAECTETGVWPGYTDRIVHMSLPGWAFTEARAEQSVADHQAATDLIAELEGIYE